MGSRAQFGGELFKGHGTAWRVWRFSDSRVCQGQKSLCLGVIVLVVSLLVGDLDRQKGDHDPYPMF